MFQQLTSAFLTKNYRISRIVKGGWQLAGGHGIINKQDAISDMFKFVDAGITTFDCADIYTGVEELVGEFLQSYRRRFGIIKAMQIKIHTKFVPDRNILSKITKRYVESIIDRSLKRLRLDSLPLVQFHWWDYSIPRYVETMKYLNDLKKKGKIENLGVTNFNTKHLKRILDVGIPIISNQIQYSVLDQRPENGMIDLCGKNNISLLCYGTLAGGFLSDKYLNVPEPSCPFENRSLIKYKLIIDDFGGWKLFQKLLLVLKKIASKHKSTIANISTKYVLQKKLTAGAIVGARNTKHLKSLTQLFNFYLDNNDIVMINGFLKKSKGLQGDVYELERIKGGKHASIMRYNLNKD